MASVPGHERRAVGAAWALTLLTTLSSVAFAAGAIAGWVIGLWPATPLTLGIAVFVVLAGPVTSAALARGVRAVPAPAPRPEPRPMTPVRVAAAPRPRPLPAPVLHSPEQVLGRELLDWRDRGFARH